jgi:hypothetical protein
VVNSVGSRGDSYDNAVAETVNGSTIGREATPPRGEELRLSSLPNENPSRQDREGVRWKDRRVGPPR